MPRPRTPVRTRPAPTIENVWRLCKANLAGLLCTLLGFGSVVYVLQHQAADKREDVCAAVSQFGDDLVTELALASHTDPTDPRAVAFRERLHKHLKDCG